MFTWTPDSYYTGWALRNSLQWGLDTAQGSSITCPGFGTPFRTYTRSVVDPDRARHPMRPAVGDFDGDGRTDLAVGLLYSQQVCLLFNAGSGKFTRSFFASGAMTNSMIASDLNRDGKPDLVIGDFVFSFAPPNVNVVLHK